MDQEYKRKEKKRVSDFDLSISKIKCGHPKDKNIALHGLVSHTL